MTYKRNKRSQKIDCEKEDSPLKEALYLTGVRAARILARSIYTISSRDLNVSVHLAVYFVFVSVYCESTSQLQDDMKHISDLPLSTQEWNTIFEPIQMYKQRNGDFPLDDIHTIAKELIQFQTSSFRIDGGYVESSPGLSDDKLYDAICKSLQQLCDLRLIPLHTPLTILNPFAGTYAGVCLYTLCHYKMRENIEAKWNITAIDSDPIAVASANCMLALWRDILNKDLGVSFTMQSGTFLFSEVQKAEVKEALMHHPKKESYIQQIQPVDVKMFERKGGACNHEAPFDLIIMASREENFSYPSEMLRYLEGVYQTGVFEYMHVEAACAICAKMKIIVQEKSWLTKRDSEQYREWIHQERPTDILLGCQHTVCVWRDVQENLRERSRQSTVIHQSGGPSFQIPWIDLKPRDGWKLQNPRVEFLIHSIKSIGQPLFSYLLGEERDPEDDYLCAILNSTLIKLFRELNEENKSEHVPIVVSDLYNPAEKKREDLIRALYQKKRSLTQSGAPQEEIRQVDALLEQSILEMYQIPMELREFVTQHAK